MRSSRSAALGECNPVSWEDGVDCKQHLHAYMLRPNEKAKERNKKSTKTPEAVLAGLETVVV